MINICIGYPRSGTHWIGNIIKHFSKNKFLQLHEKYRIDLNYDKVVYIKRHPAGIIESTMRTFNIENEDINIINKWKLCNWKEHVESWKNQQNVLYVEYEDIMENPIKEFKKILKWFDITYTEQKLVDAINYFSVENIKMRGEEPSPKGSWRGDNGWKNKLSSKFIKEIEDTFLK